jgi:hypothetical protein
LLDPCPKIKLCEKDTQNKRKEKKSFDWKKRGKIKRYQLFKCKTRMKGNQLQIVYIDPHIY